MKLTLTIFSFLIFLPLFSQSIDFSNFVEIKSNSSKYKQPNSNNTYYLEKDSLNNYLVSKEKSKRTSIDSIPFSEEHLRKKIGENYGFRTIKKVFNGYLISYNNGEFGGNLYFISNNGKKAYLVERITRIVDFIEINNSLFATSGLAHLASSRGSLYELVFDKKWRTNYKENFKSYPYLYLKNKSETYIITSNNLYKIHSNFSLQNILTLPFSLDIFYPNSSVIITKDLYIAMRSSILQIKNFETNPTFHWYEEIM